MGGAGVRPRIWAASAPARSSSGSRAPFQATRAPPRSSSGAAYSARTASDESALAVTISYRSAPSAEAHSSARAGMAVALSTSAVTARRVITSHLRAVDSIRSTWVLGRAAARTRPGNPAPAPMSAIRVACRSGGASRPERASAMWTSTASAGSVTVVGGDASAARAVRRVASLATTWGGRSRWDAWVARRSAARWGRPWSAARAWTVSRETVRTCGGPRG